MRFRIRSRTIAAGLLGITLGCGGGTEPPPVAACTAPATITVSTSIPLTFSWTPACGVDRLVVSEALPPSLGFVGSLERWAIRADARLIGPPVRYGQTPRGAVVEVAHQSITVGRTYGVSAFLGGGMVGSASFSSAP